jgi:VanZ family protein
MVKKALNQNAEQENSRTRRRVWRYGPLLLWIAFISFASTQEFSAANTSRFIRPILLWLFPNITEATITTVHFVVRKAAHFTEYAILARLAFRAFVTSSHTFMKRRAFQLSLVLIVSYSLLDEFHQSFVSSRTASIYDSFIDIAGGVAALLIFWSYDKRTRKRQAGGG